MNKNSFSSDRRTWNLFRSLMFPVQYIPTLATIIEWKNQSHNTQNRNTQNLWKYKCVIAINRQLYDLFIKILVGVFVKQTTKLMESNLLTFHIKFPNKMKRTTILMNRRMRKDSVASSLHCKVKKYIWQTKYGEKKRRLLWKITNKLIMRLCGFDIAK